MSRPRSTAQKLLASVGVLAGTAAFVSFGAFSAFTGTSSNTSTLGTANINLTNVPSSGTALVELTDLIPGDVVTKCVAVTNASDMAADVTLTSVEGGTNTALLDELLTSVEEGTLSSGSASSGCANFASADPVDYDMGTGALTLTGNYSGIGEAGSLTQETFDDWAVNATRYFRIQIAVPVNIAETFEDKAATLALQFSAAPGRAPNTGL